MGTIRVAILYFLFLPLLSIGQVGIAGEQVDINSSDKIFELAQHMPKFPGGQDALSNYIHAHLNYPDECKDSNIAGTVYVQFVVNADGHVSDARITKSVHPLLDAEAIAMVSAMPDWIPGEQDGEKVRVYYSLPVSFGSNVHKANEEYTPPAAESFEDNPTYQKIFELLDRNNSKAALKQVNALLRKNPKSGDLLMMRGIVHCYRKEKKQSLQDMHEAGMLGSHIAGVGALVDQYCK